MALDPNKTITFHICLIVFMIVGIVFFKECLTLLIMLFLLITETFLTK